MSTYIEPVITFYDKFADCCEAKNDYSRYWNKTEFADIFGKKRVVVLAEPGYGKTRMLKEIVIRAHARGKKAMYVDLKAIPNDVNIKEYVNGSIATSVSAASLDSEDKIVANKCIISDGFSLENSENTILCFDALDEVQTGEPFSKVVRELKDFTQTCDKVSVIVSCRTHHFKRHDSDLNGCAFTFCLVSDFGPEQVRAFLAGHKLLGDTDQIVEQLADSAVENILRTPRYLTMFVELVGKIGVESVLKLDRTDLFEKFIYGKLASENTENREVLKRVLEKLAMVMEIYQANKLTKDELLTCFDTIDSHLSAALLQSSGWRILLDESLIKDNVEYIEFENTEFQEYLAAKELTRIAKNDQVLYDLVVDAELKEVMPSWFHTLGFLVELDISKVKPLLELGSRNANAVQDTDYHRLLTTVRTERLDEDLRKEVFERTFDYYQRDRMWLKYDVAKKLAFYCVPSSLPKLLEPLEDAECGAEGKLVPSTNAICVISYLLQYRLFDGQRDSFRDHLVKVLERDQKSLQDEIILALRNYGDLRVFEAIEGYLDVESHWTLERLIHALAAVGPNSELAFKYVVEGTHRRLPASRDGLYSMTGTGPIKRLLSMLSNDVRFLEDFLYLESICKDGESQLIVNVRNVADDEVLDAIEELVFAVCKQHDVYDAHRSRYITELVSLLKDKRLDVLTRIVVRIKNEGIDPLSSWGLDPIVKTLLTEDNAEQFIREIITVPNGRIFAFYLFNGYDTGSPFNELGKRYLAEEHRQFAEKREEYLRQHQDDDVPTVSIYDQFKRNLGTRDAWYWDVFRFYQQHSNELRPLLSRDDVDALKDAVFSVLKDDPLQGQLRITEQDGGKWSYTSSLHSQVFHHCVAIAKEFEWELAAVRQNIINSIPFAYSSDLELVFGCIPDLGQVDAKPLLDVYTQRTDNLDRFMPGSFIDACDKYNLVSAVPILDKFVRDTRMLLQDRREALKTRTRLCTITGKEFLEAVFTEYMDSSPELAGVANELLIEHFSAENAIRWRIERIKERAFQCVQEYDSQGMRTPGEEETEFHSKTFAHPLLGVSDVRYLDVYNALLAFSFAKTKEDQKYYPYANYIWDIVCAYFLNLRTYRRYEYVQGLEREVYKQAGEGGSNWFKYRIQDLKRQYSMYISKPDDILTCIGRYNGVANSAYVALKTNHDLVEFVKEVIEKDLRRFVESEGFYREIAKAAGRHLTDSVKKLLVASGFGWLVDRAKGHQEDLIQKTLKTQLENSFLRKGLRTADIIREPQLLDDKRIDFWISYGFLGPVLIETKTTSNKEIHSKAEREAYKSKIEQYVSGYGAVFCYFLVFQTSDIHPLNVYRPELEKVYEGCGKIGLQYLCCTGPSGG